jgi:hypothetical protein
MPPMLYLGMKERSQRLTKDPAPICCGIPIALRNLRQRFRFNENVLSATEWGKALVRLIALEHINKHRRMRGARLDRVA